MKGDVYTQPAASGSRSKFAQRFNLTGSGMTATNSDQKQPQTDMLDRTGTPSTSAASSLAHGTPDPQTISKASSKKQSMIQATQGDPSQWIKKPRGLGVLGQQIVDSTDALEDPLDMLQKMGQREISILNDYMNLWTRSLTELLQKLRDTVPKEGMIGEVHYWRDLSRVLDAVAAEMQLPYVETVVQIMAQVEKDEAIMQDVKNFYGEKDRVMRGKKEAAWNHKYMRIIEKPV